MPEMVPIKRSLRIFVDGVPHHKVYFFWPSDSSNGSNYTKSNDKEPLKKCECTESRREC